MSAGIFFGCWEVENGTTHVIFEPLDFNARLAALVSKLRADLTCFYGVFAPNSTHRALLTQQEEARVAKNAKDTACPDDTRPTEWHVSITWAQRLKRVFSIGIETCEHCHGSKLPKLHDYQIGESN